MMEKLSSYHVSLVEAEGHVRAVFHFDNTIATGYLLDKPQGLFTWFQCSGGKILHRQCLFIIVYSYNVPSAMNIVLLDKIFFDVLHAVQEVGCPHAFLACHLEFIECQHAIVSCHDSQSVTTYA